MKIYPTFLPHAGCPHRCLFCAQEKTTGASRLPDPGEVTRWLDAVLPEQGDGEAAFYGGTFTLLPPPQQDAYLAAAAPFAHAGRIRGIRVSTRPDALDEECLERLRAGGVTTIEIGCQSFDDAVLANAGRGHSAAQSLAAVLRCRTFGFAVGIQLLPGLPGDHAGLALDSLRTALASRPAFVRIYPAVVIAGTELAALWKHGRYTPWSLDEAIETCADMLVLCYQAGVPVARLGLQQEAQLETGLLAGPYHPAFGQLVRSRLWRRLLTRADLSDSDCYVNPADLSDLYGHRRANRDCFGGRSVSRAVKTDRAVRRGMLRTAIGELSIYDPGISGVH